MERQYVVTSTRICDGVCLHYKAKKIKTNYRPGVKYCSFCQVFMEYEGLYCPCCGQRMRVRTRNSKERKRIA